jgi:hypothetical protein
MVDFFPFSRGEHIRVTIEQTNSEWRQGVSLDAYGKVVVANQTINGPIVLWEDTAPAETDIMVSDAPGVLEVKNVWDTGDGVTQSWHNGAAMVLEGVDGGRRYLCNDGRPDEDFDDIVFRIERIRA